MKKRNSYLTAILVTLILAVMLVPFAAAAGTVDPETDVGSIAITLKKDGSPVPGIPVRLWRVGAGGVEDGQLVFRLLPELQDAALELNGLNGAQNTQTAAKLLEFCDAQGIVPEDVTEKITDTSGTTCFEDLPVGVYLVRSGATNAYRAITPYLLQLPAQNEGGTAWDLDVQGAPKVEAQPDDDGGGTPPDDPLPGDPPPDDPPPDSPPPDAPEDPPGQMPPAPETPMLPQTGLLQWPVPVLTVAGLVLITAGLVKRRKDGCA